MSENEDIKTVVNLDSTEDAERFLEIAENKAQEWRELSNTQLRRIYDTVLNINNERVRGNDSDKQWYKKLQLLRPKLAYSAGRQTISPEQKAFLDNLIKEVGNDERKFQNFLKFFEALIGYHRTYTKKK